MMIIDYVFAALNFAVFVAFLVYVVRRYALPSLLNEYQHDQAYRSAIVKELESARLKVVAVQEKQAEQRIFTELLKNKVALWKNAFAQQQEELRQQKELCALAMQEAQEKRRHALIMAKTMELVAPEVLEKTKTELCQQFANKKNAQAYLDKIVQSLKKDLS